MQMRFRRCAPWRRIRSKTASPFSSHTIASPSIRHERTGSLLAAIAIKGKREEKSFPARVISRTPALSRRASMRKPSCLISWSQPGPEGEALAGEGRHGSMIPSPGRVRSRNDMRASNRNRQSESRVGRRFCPLPSGLLLARGGVCAMPHCALPRSGRY